MQWFCFTAIALVGFVVLVRADLRDRRKAEAKARRVAEQARVEGAAEPVAAGRSGLKTEPQSGRDA